MTQAGFWRNMNSDNRRLYLRDAPLISNVWYLFPQGGGPNGAHSFQTFTDLAPNLRSRDTILLSGVLREQAVCPVGVFDVSIIGASNRPRQATNGGVPTGGGASWLSPTVPTAAPLLQVIEQGWRIENIQFAPVAAQPCIRFRRRETATIPDASHGAVVGCYFSTGGAAGVGIDVTETKNLEVAECSFEALGAGACITNTADGGIATNAYHHIHHNRFLRGNALEIDLATNDSLIEWNTFYALFGVEGGFRIDLQGGARNRVFNNWFSDATAQYAVAGGYRTGAATDRWRNWVGDANDQIVANPA
jgi:hypothetical protein